MRLEEPRRRRRLSESGDDWAVLPSELLDLIVLRLPLLAIVRARCVCKSWNDAIRSPGFAIRKSLLDRDLGVLPRAWLVTLIGRYKRKWVWLYDPATGRRRQIMLPSSLKGHFYNAVVAGGFIFVENGYVPCDGGGGGYSTKYVAWNPITGLVKELLVPQSYSIAVVSTSESHKLYALESSGDGVEERRRIFAESGESWNRINFLTFRNLLLGTYSDGFVYRTKVFRDRTVTAQNLVTSKVTGIELPEELERKSRWGVKLVNSEGSLLLVVACTPIRRDGNRMQVWRLVRVPPPGGSRWEFVSGMPENLYELVFPGKVNAANWKCTAVNHLVFVSRSHRRVEEAEGVVVLDMRTSIWSKIEDVHHDRQHCLWSAPCEFYPSFAGLDDSSLPPSLIKDVKNIDAGSGAAGTSQTRSPFFRSAA